MTGELYKIYWRPLIILKKRLCYLGLLWSLVELDSWNSYFKYIYFFVGHFCQYVYYAHANVISLLAKIDLNKKWLPKQKTIQNFNIDAQGFRKTKNENPPMREIGVTS